MNVLSKHTGRQRCPGSQEPSLYLLRSQLGIPGTAGVTTGQPAAAGEQGKLAIYMRFW